MEQLKHLGPKAHKWLLTMLNICFMWKKIPTIWRQSKIIAILKQGKDSSIPKNYRPISLLCHTYKLYERMILNRIAHAIEQHLIKEQTGFISAKSCTSQLLNLTQHMDDGYEEGMITQPQRHCKCLQQTVHQHYSSQDQHHKQKITRKVHRLQPTQINITTEQVQTAIKNSKNNNSTGPDNINIKHLKNIGKNGLQYLTDIYNAAINDNKIPHVWKLANIIPIPKPNKDINIGTSYRPISLLSVIAKTLEKVILPYITQNIPNITTQHGFKTKHSTNTALHNINNTVATGFNQPIPPTRTIAVAFVPSYLSHDLGWS